MSFEAFSKQFSMLPPIYLSGFLSGLSASSVAVMLLLAPAIAQDSTQPNISQPNSPQIDSSQPTVRPSLSPATNPNISFRRPLRVVDIYTPNNLELRRSEYHFRLDFPADAVEPLQKLVFEQISGVDYPRYRDRDFYAFNRADRTPLPLSVVENNPDQRTIVVEFDPPVEPGREVTVVLKARNPRDGIYTYQLTAFPVGATEGQYAGVERLNIDEPFRRRDRFRWF